MGPSGTFKLFGRFTHDDLFEEISQSFHSILEAKGTLILDLSDLNQIIEKYHSAHKLDWNLTILNLPTTLDPASISLLHPYIGWECIIKNATANILPLLRQFQSEVNWETVQSCGLDIWDENIVCEFKDHLLFKKRLWRDSLFNKIGTEYRANMAVFNHKYISVSSSRIKWSGELINKLQDYIEWDELSENIHVPYEEDLIDEFLEYWNWSKLSKNRGIHWSEALLKKYIRKIDLKSLSNNTNVAWAKSLSTLNLYSTKENSLDWGLLSINRSFTAEMLERNKDCVVWQAPTKSYLDVFKFDSNYRTTNSVFILKQSDNKYDSYYEYANGLKINICPSLSANTNFSWSDEIISKYFKRLDFWTIALRGNLTTDLVIKYAAFFDELRMVYTSYQKHSDWGTYDVYHFHNGWQNLAINPNFSPNDGFNAFAEQRTVRVISATDTFDEQSGTLEDILNGGTWVTVASIFRGNHLNLNFDYSKL